MERIRAPLSPLTCPGDQLYRVLHITSSCPDISGVLSGKDILVWDAGRGSRMGSLVKDGKSKGNLYVRGSHRLFHFSAGAAIWLVDTLKKMHREYVGFIACDQVVSLSDQMKQELTSSLEVASEQGADVIFFDGPPALSLMRLRYFLDRARQPRKDSLASLNRERTLLKNHGGGHVLQCVLLKRKLVTPLTNVLKVILQAVRDGFDLDYGVTDVAILPQLVQPRWLARQDHPAARKIYSALCDWRDNVKNIFPVSVPIEVLNCNTPLVLKRLQKRISQDSQAQRSFDHV